MFIFMFVIGLGLIIYGISALSSRIKFIPMSKIITGIVIDMHMTPAGRGRTAYYPVIEYSDPETNSLERYEHEIANGNSKYNIGDSLELRYYNGEGKRIVLINTWSGIWLAPIVFIIAGVVFAAFGLLIKLL